MPKKRKVSPKRANEIRKLNLTKQNQSISIQTIPKEAIKMKKKKPSQTRANETKPEAEF
jgi:hypothetical protein